MRSSSLCLTQCRSILISLFLIFLKPGAVSYPAKITHKLYVQDMFIILRNKLCNVYFWGSRILKCAIFNFGAQGFNAQLVSPKMNIVRIFIYFGCFLLFTPLQERGDKE